MDFVLDVSSESPQFDGVDLFELVDSSLYYCDNACKLISPYMPDVLVDLIRGYMTDGSKLGLLKSLSICQTGDISRYYADHFGDFQYFLLQILTACTSLQSLSIQRLHLDSIFTYLTPHPTPNLSLPITYLELKYLDISGDDMQAIGPCFSNVHTLKWYMNRFDEVAYENYIEPYFEDIIYENDDGWYPGCELWGDGQRTQEKNSDKYY